MCIRRERGVGGGGVANASKEKYQRCVCVCGSKRSKHVLCVDPLLFSQGGLTGAIDLLAFYQKKKALTSLFGWPVSPRTFPPRIDTTTDPNNKEPSTRPRPPDDQTKWRAVVQGSKTLHPRDPSIAPSLGWFQRLHFYFDARQCGASTLVDVAVDEIPIEQHLPLGHKRA